MSVFRILWEDLLEPWDEHEDLTWTKSCEFFDAYLSKEDDGSFQLSIYSNGSFDDGEDPLSVSMVAGEEFEDAARDADQQLLDMLVTGVDTMRSGPLGMSFVQIVVGEGDKLYGLTDEGSVFSRVGHGGNAMWVPIGMTRKPEESR